MELEQVKKTVEGLIADVYPVIMHQSIMEGFSKAPNAGDPLYWENIRLGLAQQQAAAGQPQRDVKKEEGDWFAEVSGDSAIITGYKGTETAIKIPSSFYGKPVTGIGRRAFQDKKLSSVIIPDSVSHIGEEAFAQCGLSCITFSGSVAHIGEEAFARNKTAEGDFMVCYSDDAKSIIITRYEGEEKALQIPSELRGLPVTQINWGTFIPEITSVNIPDNVYIGGGPVNYYLIIRTITIGSNVTIDGNNFDRINGEKIKDFSPGPQFVPLAKLYNNNGRKAGTFTLGKSQWDYKPGVL